MVAEAGGRLSSPEQNRLHLMGCSVAPEFSSGDKQMTAFKLGCSAQDVERGLDVWKAAALFLRKYKFLLIGSSWALSFQAARNTLC